ncbi:MAG: M15 family metallopeptidase [Solobacterium sp.]|nr:M15 family metallopeptidase [Solobacterium sp.]
MTQKKVVRKRRKRYKLVWPWKNSKLRLKRRKLKIRKEVLYLLVALFALFLLFFIPRHLQTSRLKKLGYKKDEIAAIRKENLANELIEKEYYSPFLANSIKDGTLNKDYLSLYTVISEDGSLDEQDFLLYNRLLDRGYTEEQLLNLFHSLRRYEMTPLLVFDYQIIETKYIEDCLNNRETNSKDHFVLTNNYYTHYANPIEVSDPNSIDMLVNKTYYLPDGFRPNDLETMSRVYAAEDRQLSSVAARAFEEFADAGQNVGVRFFITSSFRSYEDQVALHDMYVKSYGEEWADERSARAGYSEHQTGLTVDIAAVNEDDKENFEDTLAYQWTKSNCQDYGWIIRFPEGKEQITGYIFESWHYRYLGKELAQAVVASGLTYDEFYCLYLKPWDNEENKPSEAILAATNWQKKQAEPEESEKPE